MFSKRTVFKSPLRWIREAIAFKLVILVTATFAMAAGGHLDFGFSSVGTTNFSFGNSSSESADAVAIQSDGKIVVAGRTNTNGSWDFAVARLNANGTFDTTFDGDGMVVIDFGGIDIGWDVALQSDGKIVVVGETTPQSGSGDFAVARLNTNGTLDATFDTDGKATVDFQAQNDFARSVAIQADGKIVIAGLGSGGNWGVARLTSAGAPDGTFGTNGRVTTDFAQLNDIAQGVAILPDGRIVVAGTANAQGSSNFALARYNTDGSLDNAFNGNGKIVTDIGTFSNDEVHGFARMADGRLVVAGVTNTTGFQSIAIVRYNADGTPDNTFDSDGKVVTMFNPSSNNYVQNIAVTGNGEIVAVGHVGSLAPGNGFSVIRYFANGSLDPKFGAGGLVNTVFGLGERDARDVAIQPDGKIVAVGTARGFGDFAVARYNPTGIAAVSDFDGGAQADFAVFRSTDGIWYQKNGSTGTQTYTTFGGPGDLPAPGDYDGDGKTDACVFRRATAVWYILRSSDNAFAAVPYGVPGDTIAQADYDGDSRTDLAVYRPSNGTWYVQRSAAGFLAYQFGGSNDRPVPADYDGDGRTDYPVFHPSDGSWWIDSSTFGQSVVKFGISSDEPVPMDFDGDSAADIAVFRASTGDWYILHSQTASVEIVHWGTTGDRPAPADFDADGRADFAVFRPQNGFWYVLQSRDKSLRSLEWGRGGDLPVPQAYFSQSTAP